MSKLQVYSVKGTKQSEIDFPKALQVKENLPLMAQVFRVFENRSHKGTKRVKTRSEVSLSTRKIYKQKGTGGARHGDKKAPIFVGGGVAHGPKGIKRVLKISKKLKNTALKMFLNYKIAQKGVFVVDKVDSIKKTKEAMNLLNSLSGVNNHRNTLIVLPSSKSDTIKYFRNIAGVSVAYWNNLSVGNIYLSKTIVLDRDIFEDKKVVSRELDSTKVELKKSLKKPETKKIVKKIAKSKNK